MKTSIELPQARLQDLEAIHQFIDEFAEPAGLDETIAFALRLAIEEAFVNLVEHGYKHAPGAVGITLQSSPDRVTVMIRDHAPPFPPEKAPRPQLDQAWQTRQVGGLGWHFIREMMDEIEYRSDPAQGNILTLVKRIG
jgi:serine/threonine-protein kinase RsbW